MTETILKFEEKKKTFKQTPAFPRSPTCKRAQTLRAQPRGRRSQGVEHLSLLHAGVKGLPEHEGVQPRPQLLGQGHDDVQVPLHVQVQVRLQAAQGLERLLPLLPAGRGRGEQKGFMSDRLTSCNTQEEPSEFSILFFIQY